MGIKLVTREYVACLDDYKREFIVDTDADFNKLPTACTGSTAVSIESGRVMIVNSAGVWVEFGGVA